MMPKKAAAKLKSSKPKLNNNKHVKALGAHRTKAAQAVSKRPALADDPRFAQAVQNYEAGLKLLHARKFERAKALLEKVAEGPMKELADRAALHLHTCEQQLARSATSSFKSPE